MPTCESKVNPKNSRIWVLVTDRPIRKIFLIKYSRSHQIGYLAFLDIRLKTHSVTGAFPTITSELTALCC